MSADLIIKQETLGERIRRLRKERNLSQTALANIVQVTFGWISQIEQDKANASPDVLNKIALALKVPVRVLLQGEDEHMEIVSRIKLVEVLLETHQPDEADSILEGLEGHPDLSEIDRLMLKVQRAEGMYQKELYGDVLQLLQPIIQSLESVNYHDAHILALIHYVMGKAYYQLRDFTNALYSYRKAYDYTKRFEMADTLSARISYNVGVTLRMKGFHAESVPFLEEAHHYFQKNNDMKTLAHTLFEKGLSYKNAKDYRKASECFEEAKVILQALDLKDLRVILQHTVATEVTMHHDPVLALVQLEQCLKTVREDRNIQRAILICTKIAKVHLHKGEYENAGTILKNTETMIETNSLHNTVEAAEFHKTCAQYLIHISAYEKVFLHANLAAELFGKMGIVMDQIDSLQLIANAYEAMGNYKEAFYYERECKKIALEVRRS